MNLVVMEKDGRKEGIMKASSSGLYYPIFDTTYT